MPEGKEGWSCSFPLRQGLPKASFLSQPRGRGQLLLTNTAQHMLTYQAETQASVAGSNCISPVQPVHSALAPLASSARKRCGVFSSWLNA